MSRAGGEGLGGRPPPHKGPTAGEQPRVIAERLEVVAHLLLDAAEDYARQARTTPHKAHVDDHRGKAERLSVTAADLQRLAWSLCPPRQAERDQRVAHNRKPTA